MEGFVYVLCAVTALACAALLLRGYVRTRTRLLLWCGLCFACLTAENTILFVDRMFITEDEYLLLHRRLVALAGVTILLYGLIWEVE